MSPPDGTAGQDGTGAAHQNGAGAAPRVPLEPAELARYARHVILPEVGLAGQERLKGSSVLIVGAGGLGSPAAMYLAAAGVGRIGVVDYDVVDASNLQRQILYTEGDVGTSKTAAAEARLHAVNPHIVIEAHDTRLTSENALEIIAAYDVVLDGVDNFPTRYLVNDACVLTGTPNAYGAIFRFEGQVSVFAQEGGPCYRCLYASPPPPGVVPDCSEAGVFGVLPGIVGTIQATEVLKLLLGIGDTLAGRLLLFDALGMEFTAINIARNPECPVCGDAPTVTKLIDYEAFCGVGATAERSVNEARPISPIDLQARLRQEQNSSDVFVLDVREAGERALCAIAGSIHIPLGELELRADEVPKDRPVVAYCKTGLRSARAVDLLTRLGWAEVHNLEGGIVAWRSDVEPEMVSY